MAMSREINGQTYDVIEASRVIFFWRDDSEVMECKSVSVVFTGDRYIIQDYDSAKMISIQADAVLYAEIEAL
jgi:hypothetical protein